VKFGGKNTIKIVVQWRHLQEDFLNYRQQACMHNQDEMQYKCCIFICVTTLFHKFCNTDHGSRLNFVLLLHYDMNGDEVDTFSSCSL
jgi:hypothetical protein